MKSYLSFGGGVNSVAMLLMLHEQKQDFEAVFVNHGTDWPETYEYLDMLQGWLEKKGLPKITVLKPCVTGYDNLYDYCWHYKMVPSFMFRWCTEKFKVSPQHAYCQSPAFTMLGIDAGESHRAKIATDKGFESRYPLIEAGITRDDCKDIIKSNGLPVPMKSGCYICPFQKTVQWKQLRRIHPELFCKAEQLEKRSVEYRMAVGKKPLSLTRSGSPLSAIVNEKQSKLWEADEYPPCNCML
jgi:3'-phosphoadenosine 5'-phosphosulfate sulfotransferase (PAPS reductase)/FAD synthetase